MSSDADDDDDDDVESERLRWGRGKIGGARPGAGRNRKCPLIMDSEEEG